MRRHSHKLSLSNKTLSTKEQAKRLKKKVYSIVDKANSEFSAERRISRRAATLVVKKSLLSTVGLEYSLREYRALKSLSEFINLAHHDKSVSTSVDQFTDLLPVGHPSSTKPHAMTASAFAQARLNWVLADPRIPSESKPLVASVLVDSPTSESYIYSMTRIESDPNNSIPIQALIASYGGGNSRAARSLRARLQRRDRYGRFAYMGGGLRALFRRGDGSVVSFTGEPVAESANGIVVESPDGKLREIKSDSNVKNLEGNDPSADLPVEFIKARLEIEGLEDGFSPTPARVKTGDPIVDEADVAILDMPPGFRVDDSYKGAGTKYTDDAYDVIKHDKPSPETRDRIGKATKELDAADRDIILNKKGDGGKTWNAEKPVYEISRRGSKTPFAFTQSWADTQERIADDEPAMDFQEGRAKAYIPRKDSNELTPEEIQEKLAEFEGKKKPKAVKEEVKPVEKPVEKPVQEVKEPVSAFSYNVPEDSYLIDTDTEYEPQGRTDQEARDYTDDPSVLSEKFTSEELSGALIESLYPEFIDSDETTDIVDAIKSDDSEDDLPVDDLEGPSEEDLEDIADVAPSEGTTKKVNAATGYGSLSFDGGDELVPAEAIYFALEQQGVDAKKAVARIYDDLNGDSTNVDALNESRGGAEQPDIADVIEEVDTEEISPEDQPWNEPWTPTDEEMESLKNELKKNQEFLEHGGFTFFRKEEQGVGDYSDEISVYKGSWDPGDSEVAKIMPDGEIDWNSDEDFDENSADLWNAFGEFTTPELPSLLANLSEEDFARYQETGEWEEFLPENLIEPSDTGLEGREQYDPYYNYSLLPFVDSQEYTSLGDNEESPEITNNPFEIASMFSTEDLKGSLAKALRNKKTGTAELAFITEDGGEESIADIPFEAIRDALQLQGFDTDTFLFDEMADGDTYQPKVYTTEKQEEARRKRYEDIQKFYERVRKEQAEYSARRYEEIRKLEEALDEAAKKEAESIESGNGIPNTQIPPAEELPVPQRGRVATVDLKPGDVSVKDGFVITEIGDRQIGGKYGAMRKVKGYFPGHVEQDTKQWYEDTPIEIYRGISIPPKGDLPALSKTNVKKGLMTQEEYDNAIAKAKSLVQEPSTVTPINAPNVVSEEKATELVAESVDAPDKTVSPKPYNRVRYPAFQGRFAELVREAELDPEKFKELLNNEEYIIFDYETTGLDSNDPNHNPFQLSAIKVKNGEIVDSFNVFMNPNAPLSEWNAKNSVDVDGNPLTQEWIDSQPSRADGHKQFLDWAGPNPMLAGFNVGFDEDFLRKNADEANLRYNPSGIMDVRALAVSSLYGDKNRPKKFDAEGNPVTAQEGYHMNDNTLKGLSDYFEVKLENWHDSRADIEATKGVFEKSLDKSIENKGNKRKVSAFDIDARIRDYINDTNALENISTEETKVVDSEEADSVGAPAVDAQNVVSADSQNPEFNESVDTYTPMPARDLQPGDIAIRPNEAFVITGVVEDPEDSDKMIINGYYPGHEMQERTWKKNTKIDVVRGVPEAELPKIGDGPALERPRQSGKYRPGSKEFDRDEASVKRRILEASSVYTRNPLNNSPAAKTRENIKTTDANTPEGRTVEWIRNSDNTQLLVGARASEIKEGDYVRTSLPNDPVVYGYVTKANYNESTQKMDYTIVDTNDGSVSNPSWNYYASIQDLRRPLRPQERILPRPLDIGNLGEDARYISSDKRTPVKEGDKVVHSGTGVSGIVTKRMKKLGDEPQTADTVDFVEMVDKNGELWVVNPSQLSIVPESLPEPEGVIDQDSDFERMRDERMEQAPPSEDGGDDGEDLPPIVSKKEFTPEEKREYKDAKVQGIIDNVTDHIIKKLEEGEVPWQSGWIAGGSFPLNPSTNEPFHGFNIFVLSVAQEEKGYSSNRWLGRGQASGMGGKLKAGEKPVEILVPKIVTDKVKDADGNVVKDADGNDKEVKKRIGWLYRDVYNVDQFDGLNLPPIEERQPVAVLDAENQILDLYKDKPPINFVEMGPDRSPAWDSRNDVINLPKREQFESPEDLLGTLLHELAHSTGHVSRLDRSDLIQNYRVHTSIRGKEELIAEIASAIAAGRLGVDIKLDNSAEYVRSWLKHLKNEGDYIYQAIQEAIKAVDYMFGEGKPSRKSDSNNKPTPNDEESPSGQGVGSEGKTGEEISGEKGISSVKGDYQKGTPNSGDLKNGMKYTVDMYEQKLTSGRTDGSVYGVRRLTVSGNTYPSRQELKDAGFRYNPSTKTWSKSYLRNVFKADSITQELLDNNPDPELTEDINKFSGSRTTPPTPGDSSNPPPSEIRDKAKMYESSWMNSDPDYAAVIFHKDGRVFNGTSINSYNDRVDLQTGTSTKPIPFKYEDIEDITMVPVKRDNANPSAPEISEPTPPPASYKPSPTRIEDEVYFLENSWMNGANGYEVVVWTNDGTQKRGIRMSSNKSGVLLESGSSTRPTQIDYKDMKAITIVPKPNDGQGAKSGQDRIQNVGEQGKTGEEIAQEDDIKPAGKKGGNDLSPRQVYFLQIGNRDGDVRKVYNAEEVYQPQMQGTMTSLVAPKRMDFPDEDSYVVAYKKYSKDFDEMYRENTKNIQSSIAEKNLNGSAKGVQNYVRDIISSDWFVEAFGDGGQIGRPPVSLFSGKRVAGKYTFSFGKNSEFKTSLKINKLLLKNEPIILHEIAHFATTISATNKFSAHGAEFRMNHIFITNKVLGREAAESLKEAYRKENLNVG